MKTNKYLFFLLIELIIFLPCATAAQESKTQKKLLDKGDFKVIYDTSPNYMELEKFFRDSQLFEGVTDELNQILNLPFDVQVVLGECDEPNAFYYPDEHQIVMCYELATHIALVFSDVTETEEKLDTALLHTTFFVFYHELGHALVDILDIPITGKEEDAVDQLSTIILAEAGEEGEDAVLNGAVWFWLSSKKGKLRELAFADQHPLDKQRFYNLICWIFGKNPERHAYLVEKGYLPEERAVRCTDEYLKMSHSWDRLLADHLK